MRAECSSRECTSGKPGLWEPVILLWPEGANPKVWQPASANLIGIVVCDDCTKTTKVIHLIPDLEHWKKITDVFAENGKIMPSLKTAKLTFVIPETHHLPSGTVFV